MKVVEGSITSPKGFKACGNSIGLKKDKKDMALIMSEVPAVCAATFTTNVVKAAPVKRDMAVVAKGGKISGVVINSGNANACTGDKGIADNEMMAKIYADILGVEADAVLTASTGVIGVMMPMDIIEKGIKSTAPMLTADVDGGHEAALAIMTTDTVNKEITVEIELDGKTVTVSGMSKGSGMIHPNMATMLGFITTDAAIERELLDEIVKECVKDTYNMISVDGDTSTNDTLIALANGMAGNEVIKEKNEDFNKFKEAFYAVNSFLAKKMAEDGEGATKLITVNIKGAKTKLDARLMAKAVIGSSLVKAAMFGEDANWGRVMCAMGYSGADFDPEKVDIVFSSEGGSILLMDKGTPVKFDEDFALKVLKEKYITVDIDVFNGSENATAWGCDLSYDYVKINGDYRS